MARNTRGQITSEHIISMKISKALQKTADKAKVRIRPIIRDELEQTLRSEIYASRTPATKKGQEVKEYNESHKHQQSHPYHHTGLLASSVYATIEGNTIKANIKDQQYSNGASTTEVYDYLKFGTTDTPKKDVYDYDNGSQFSRYISQEPHNFEARTREYMRSFINNLSAELKTEAGRKRYIGKYKNKRL